MKTNLHQAVGEAALPRVTVHKGRGAVSNESGRFEIETRSDFDDGWITEDLEAPSFRTTIGVDSSRSIITRNTSPDIPFDRSINPYRGCEHGCIYCYARPSHAYLGLSPGLDFESRLFAKPNAAALLEQELRRPAYTAAPIAFGTNTDPYQPVERNLGVTRALLEVLDRFNHPLTIVTKSTLVLRDLDILSSMARRDLCSVTLSVTTLDRRLARIMEPRAVTPDRRLDAIRQLSAAGVPAGALVAPVIPAINDHEIEGILEAVAGAGAKIAGYVLLRLPYEVADLFQEWLAEHFPDRAGRVLSLVRQTRSGELYQSAWGERQKGTGPVAALIAQRFAKSRRRFGLNQERRGKHLDCSRFMPPPVPGDQLSLF